MPRRHNQTKHRRFRLYDGGGHYIQIPHISQVDMPGKEPRTETEIQTDGGLMTNDAATYTPDETPPFRPIPVSFMIGMFSNAWQAIHAFGNYFDLATWTVGPHTWTPVLEASLGTRKNSDGDDIDVIVPVDSELTGRFTDLVEINTAHPLVVGATDFILRRRGLVVRNIQTGPDGVLTMFKLDVEFYGGIEKLDAVPAGTESVITA